MPLRPSQPNGRGPEESLIGELVEHERAYHSRILSSPPLSEERSRLLTELYERTWNLLSKLDVASGRPSYQDGHADRVRDALALRQLVAGGRCLEFGAGGGALAHALGELGWRLDGWDVIAGPDWEAITEASGDRVCFRVGNIATAPIEAGAYDLCVLDNCLEHIPPGDYEAVLAQAHRALREGGWLVVIIPNPLTGPHDCTRYVLPKGSAAEGSHFSERSIRQLAEDLRRAGFGRLATVAYGGLPAGRRGGRWGWSRLWYVKARLLETLLSLLPPALRDDRLFAYAVPPVLAGQKMERPSAEDEG